MSKFNTGDYIKLIDKENRTEFEESKLIKYNIFLSDIYAFNNRKDYFNLVNALISEEILPQTFRCKILELDGKTSDAIYNLEKSVENLREFEVDFSLEKQKFNNLMHYLYNVSESVLEFGVGFESESGVLSEAEFKSLVKNATDNYISKQF